MIEVRVGDCRELLRAMPERSVHCCVTSPPYFGLRDYGVEGQIGLEPTPDEFVAQLVAVFREVRRVLRDDGTLWLNLGDSYNAYNGNRGRSTSFQSATEEALPLLPPGAGLTVKGLANKQLIGIPWRVAFALQADGWYLRQDIIWHKPNPMPESVRDRCTKSHEYVFLLSKSARYHYDSAAIAEAAKEPAGYRYEGGYRDMVAHAATEGKAHKGNRQHIGNSRTETGAVPHFASGHGENRNKRSVWTVPTVPYSGAHFATFPPDLIEPCIKAGCPSGGTVLDPFGGAGTTGLVADRLGRNAILCELNPQYAEIARNRIRDDAPLFAEVA